MKESARVSEVRGGFQAGIVWGTGSGAVIEAHLLGTLPTGCRALQASNVPNVRKRKENKTYRFHLRVIILVT